MSAFQRRFEELLREGKLVSEARTQALRYVGLASALTEEQEASVEFRVGDEVELSPYGREQFGKTTITTRRVVRLCRNPRLIVLDSSTGRSSQYWAKIFWMPLRRTVRSDAPQQPRTR